MIEKHPIKRNWYIIKYKGIELQIKGTKKEAENELKNLQNER